MSKAVPQRREPHFAVNDGAIRDHCATTLLAHLHHDSPLLADLNLGK